MVNEAVRTGVNDLWLWGLKVVGIATGWNGRDLLDREAQTWSAELEKRDTGQKVHRSARGNERGLPSRWV